MSPEAIIEVLGYANGTSAPVRLMLRDGSELIGVPSSVDTHVAAHEVFLMSSDEDDEMEIAVSLATILSAELIS